MKELLTASRMESMLTCPRRHYWRYECGLRRMESAAALRFGSAWHAGMEVRWRKGTAAEVFAAATAGGECDELAVATLTAMLGAYYEVYRFDEVREIHPEVEFQHPIARSRTFQAAGKIDGLAVLDDGRLALVEHKTTGMPIDPNAGYWLRLRANSQVYQYVMAARLLGWDISTVIYDVARKPSIKPKNIAAPDADGLKTVLDDTTGERVFGKNGKPRQSAGAGMTLQTRPETPEEYGERLHADCLARPEFYFARREVPVLDSDLEEFADLQVQVGRMIQDRRRQQKGLAETPERAWPRHVSGMVCPGCEYVGFCLQNIIPRDEAPIGFEYSRIHEELEEATK